MSVKKGLAWGLGIIVAVGCIIGLVFVFLTLGEKPANSPNQERAATETKEENSSSEGFNTEIVNEPTPKSVVTMADGSDGHSFISNYHDFYNETLGWGRHRSANYNEQAETAKEILQKLEGVQITNNEIAQDFQKIKETAESLIQKNNVQTMLNLHRLFHDLDIYFNGYNHNQLFHVTKFKGN